LALCSIHAQAQTEDENIEEPVWPLNVQIQIDSIIANDPLLETSQLGMMVIDLTSDSVIHTYNHQQTMRPASTMKLVTAITALHRLGGNHQLTTSLYYTGTINDRTLNGTLFCVGGMDPTFDTADLRNFAYQVKSLNIDTLRGSIATDCSMKESTEWGEGWCWDDDNPTLSPLLVDKKANFTERLIAELNNAGVVIDSLTLFEETPPLDAILLAQTKHSIDQVLMRMMKESDNLYAECLYYQVAASYGNRPARATYARGIEKQLVNSIGLNSDNYRFADGSGLSLYNYVSPELLARFLYFAWKSPRIYQHLLPTLPIAGEDGTLKKRMKKTPAQGNVKAKTGTLTGIISLAGYLTAENGHELCFAIINQGVMRGKEARTFQDKVCVALCGKSQSGL
jgi:D-alanyl-D-alanine carboxypeptidase/D-alanyl-D-alanine-endopeptidase (penicillin-binding protein 4)